MQTKTKKKLDTILTYLGIAAGLAIVLYFPVSEYMDMQRRSEVASVLDKQARDVKEVPNPYVVQAHAYNRLLLGDEDPDVKRDDIRPYEEQLVPEGLEGSAMSCVLIPSISLEMPVYHGTDDTN